MKKIKETCPGSSYKVLMDDTLLVDIRETEEYNKVKFDVPHTIHIPFSEFENRFQKIPKNKAIIVASYLGEKGKIATKYLLENGYENVSNMSEGLSKWLHKRYPVLGDKYFDLR
ncbi:MAG TPA: rhodanese-like domain-containing protein [Bacteroidetes bacterium]|nr:rhodanese-like domain-containing protein [Bacteroidota bacterium]